MYWIYTVVLRAVLPCTHEKSTHEKSTHEKSLLNRGADHFDLIFYHVMAYSVY